jgi:hypothetical protein
MKRKKPRPRNELVLKPVSDKAGSGTEKARAARLAKKRGSPEQSSVSQESSNKRKGEKNMARETSIQPFPTVEERLEALKGSRDFKGDLGGNGVTDGPGCRFEVEVPRDLWDRIKTSEQEVFKLLQTEGVDVMMKAFLSVSGINAPRDRGFEFGCKMEGGKVSCGGGWSGRF